MRVLGIMCSLVIGKYGVQLALSHTHPFCFHVLVYFRNANEPRSLEHAVYSPSSHDFKGLLT